MEHDAKRATGADVTSAIHDLIAALADGGVETVPAGWQTAQQLANECGKSLARTSEILRAGMRAGMVEVRTFRIRAGNKVYPVPHYRRIGK